MTVAVFMPRAGAVAWERGQGTRSERHDHGLRGAVQLDAPPRRRGLGERVGPGELLVHPHTKRAAPTRPRRVVTCGPGAGRPRGRRPPRAQWCRPGPRRERQADAHRCSIAGAVRSRPGERPARAGAAGGRRRIRVGLAEQHLRAGRADGACRRREPGGRDRAGDGRGSHLPAPSGRPCAAGADRGRGLRRRSSGARDRRVPQDRDRGHVRV